MDFSLTGGLEDALISVFEDLISGLEALTSGLTSETGFDDFTFETLGATGSGCLVSSLLDCDNMAADYELRPELDQYDPDMLDDGEHAPITVSQRRAAEQALNVRDRRAGNRRRGRSDPGSPGFALSNAGLSDAESSGRESAGRSRIGKRRRTAGGGDGDDPFPTDRDDPDANEDDEDVPESYYDLTHEKLDEIMNKGLGIDKRLEAKIKKCFQQFVLKFKVEGASEPRYPDMLRKMAEDNQQHLDVNFAHIQTWSGPLAGWIADYPLKILPILNETLMHEAARKFETYKKMQDDDLHELRVGVHSFFLREHIRQLNTKHLNRLVSVNGVVTKRSKVFNEVKRLYLACAKCNYPSGPFDVATDKELKPGTCIECQSKGPWRVDRQQTIYRNHQKVTIQESPSTVEPGKMPRSKDMVLHGDMVDTIRPGDELQLTGVYKCLYDATTNARTCFPVFKTEIEAVHVHRRGDVKLIEITEDKQKQIMELSRDPNIRERFIASMAPSIYGMKHVKTAIAISMMGGQPKVTAGKHRIRGDINTLIVGDPGLAKSH